MSVGTILDKPTIDNTLGGLARTLRVTFTSIQRFKEYTDTLTTQNMIDQFGYTSGEVAILKSALVDLDKLRTIFEGTGTQASTYDFRTFAKQVWGLGI